MIIILQVTGSSPRCPLRSNSTIRSKNDPYFVVIKPQIKKKLFRVCVVFKNILPGIEQRLSTVR